MYGFRLWFFKGARNKWALEDLRKMQRKAAVWITGAFHMSPSGGVEALAGLCPMYLTLKRQATQAACRVATLSDSHPLCSIMSGKSRKGAEMHPFSLENIGDQRLVLKVNSAVLEASEIAE